MPDGNKYGLCSACVNLLAAPHYALALQRHSITYAGTGETPNEQARLHIDAIVKQVRFCSNECCKAHHSRTLEAGAATKTVVWQRILNGPTLTRTSQASRKQRWHRLD
jgi:hypothetical protein